MLARTDLESRDPEVGVFRFRTAPPGLRRVDPGLDVPELIPLCEREQPAQEGILGGPRDQVFRPRFVCDPAVQDDLQGDIVRVVIPVDEGRAEQQPASLP